MGSAVVGQSVPRLDVTGKALGKTLYAGDLHMPGMLYAKILRSPVPHARIKSIDATAARSLPGVKQVITADDAPRGPQGSFVKDESLFARDRVRQVGERVAAVAAVSPEVAEEALDLIRVEYEELPPVVDPESAMAEGAPLVHETANEYIAVWPALRAGNVCTYVKLRRGDADSAMAGAAAVYEQRFSTQAVHHSYIEPGAVTAWSDESDKLTIRASTQAPFELRSAIAGAFRLPLTKVHVVGSNVGGGFGGKTHALDHLICALLARMTGRPVKLVLTREEEMINGHPRHPVVMQLKVGADQDGRLLAVIARAVMDAGAVAKFAPMATANLVGMTFGCYRLPNVKLDAYAAYTHKVAGGAMRGPGSTQGCFALESAMDELARQLGLHPLELRLRNAAEEGDVTPAGQVLPRLGLKTVLNRAQDVMREAEARKRPGTGVGVAVGFWPGGGIMTSNASVRLNSDGTVVLATGAQDMGQGSDTVLAQIVAEELGARYEDVTVISADTDLTPPDSPTFGSRVTFAAGSAARQAAAEVKKQLLARAADRLEAAVDDLETGSGRVWVRGTPDKAVAFAELLRSGHMELAQISGTGFWEAKVPSFDRQVVQGAMNAAYRHPVFNVQVAEVAVDTDTGQTRLLALHAVQDVGHAINPGSVEGQIEGGASMGVGFALSERYIFGADGRVLNANLTDYKLPTAVDVPSVQAGLVEEPSADGPFGAKGVGEPPGIPTAPAIANAIRDAVGVRLTSLPLRPEELYWALKDKEVGAGQR